MLRFGKTNIAKEKFYGAKKKNNKIWNVEVNNMVISNLTETNNNSKYLIEYLDEVIKPLVLILPKSSEHIKTYKDKDGNKLTSFGTDDGNLWKKVWNHLD